ncbi:unnamed protein product [Notodromas monacha]|uniref:PWWP domain-containing protein n=1 Tax=Notodromas monacha TaxID=399045 RepID=A0A7R9BNL7_9CRUS|nr:unnamed protein product [Notodromas monacha]CAG0918498.1 unnamed protein product [Notodromas monacha]
MPLAEPKFKIGDVVFAKIKGYPHWPARVEDVSISKAGITYKVFFFGSYEAGCSKEQHVEAFIGNEEVYGKPRPRARFNEAMEEARTKPNLTLEDVRDEIKDRPPTVPPALPKSSPVKDEDKEEEDMSANTETLLVKAPCGEYVKISVTVDEKTEEVEENMKLVKEAIQTGEYVPSGLKRRLDARMEVAKNLAKSNKRFKPMNVAPRDVEIEFLKNETYFVMKTRALSTKLKEHQELSKEDKNTKQVEEEMCAILKEMTDAEACKRASPVVLLKNPQIFHVIRELTREAAGEAVSVAADPMMDMIASIFGIHPGQSFLSAYIVRKRFPKHTVKPWCFDRMFPERFLDDKSARKIESPDSGGKSSREASRANTPSIANETSVQEVISDPVCSKSSLTREKSTESDEKSPVDSIKPPTPTEDNPSRSSSKSPDPEASDVAEARLSGENQGKSEDERSSGHDEVENGSSMPLEESPAVEKATTPAVEDQPASPGSSVSSPKRATSRNSKSSGSKKSGKGDSSNSDSDSSSSSSSDSDSSSSDDDGSASERSRSQSRNSTKSE